MRHQDSFKSFNVPTYAIYAFIYITYELTILGRGERAKRVKRLKWHMRLAARHFRPCEGLERM